MCKQLKKYMYKKRITTNNRNLYQLFDDSTFLLGSEGQNNKLLSESDLIQESRCAEPCLCAEAAADIQSDALYCEC